MKKKPDEWKCGFLKCKVLPPQKLLFVLCNQCAILKDHTKNCSHSEDERALKGTWCLHEIYEILENDELLYYEKKEFFKITLLNFIL